MSEYPLKKLINQKQNALWDLRASYIIDENKKLYFERALINIMADDNLAKMAKTEKGAYSILLCVDKALQIGLQIGGQIPQAYLIPFGETVSLCPTAVGYKHIVISNPPVLKKFRIEAVYDGDDIQVSRKEGILEGDRFFITEKKRKLLGIACEIIELDGTIKGDYISRGEIEEIRQKWSKQPNGKAWTNSFEQMALAKAAKRFLKPYAALKEGLRMAYDTEDEIKEDSRNIEDRAVNIIDVAMPEPEPEVEEPTKNKKVEPENKNVNPKDFF